MDSVLWPLMRVGAYRLRGLLAALGIAAGAATMVIVANVIKSGFERIVAGFESVGGDAIYVSVASELSGSRQPQPLRLADADLLRRQVEEIDTVSPKVSVPVPLRACGRSQFVVVAGITPEEQQVQQLRVSDGRFIADADVKNATPVAVIGPSVEDVFRCLRFAARKSVSIGGVPYRVIGRLEKRGQRLGLNLDRVVFIPATTAERRHGEQARGQMSMMITVKSGADVLAVSEKVRAALRRHRQTGIVAEDDLTIQTHTEALASVRSAADTMSTLFATLMSWSLIVAAIGVMNSVYAMVLERTPEIGLMRTVGATRRAIQMQFLVESVVIAAAGGVVGAAAGIVATFGICAAAGIPSAVNYGVAVSAVLLSVSLGVAAGVFPALRAARVTPIDAVRYE